MLGPAERLHGELRCSDGFAVQEASAAGIWLCCSDEELPIRWSFVGPDVEGRSFWTMWPAGNDVQTLTFMRTYPLT